MMCRNFHGMCVHTRTNDFETSCLEFVTPIEGLRDRINEIGRSQSRFEIITRREWQVFSASQGPPG